MSCSILIVNHPCSVTNIICKSNNISHSLLKILGIIDLQWMKGHEIDLKVQEAERANGTMLQLLSLIGDFSYNFPFYMTILHHKTVTMQKNKPCVIYWHAFHALRHNNMGKQEQTSNPMEQVLGFWVAHELKVSWDTNTCNFKFKLKESLG